MNSQIKGEANSKKISKSSYKILIEKLEKSLNSVGESNNDVMCIVSE